MPSAVNGLASDTPASGSEGLGRRSRNQTKKQWLESARIQTDTVALNATRLTRSKHDLERATNMPSETAAVGQWLD